MFLAALAGPVHTVAAAGAQDALVDGVNAQRSYAGLPALQVATNLSWIAQWRADDMAARRYFGHGIPPGGLFVFPTEMQLDFPYWHYGEILVWELHDKDAYTVVRLWMGSPEHRDVIMDPESYTSIGAGSADGVGGQYSVVEVGG